jgi:hypothetical protein
LLLDWIGLGMIALLDWIGLDWIGLGMIALLDWIGDDRVAGLDWG